MKTPIMGIQLYTLRDFIKTAADFDSTLNKLRKMGVDTVQISGIGDFPADEQKTILDKYNMKVCVTHKSIDRMESDMDALIEEHKIIDCDALGLGSCPDDSRDTYEQVKAFVSKAEGFGKQLRKNGMTFNYHNHDFEFKKLSDCEKTIMDILLNEADPELFNFIPDVGWIHYAGFDPVELLHKMKGRVKVIHFKDYVIDNDGNRKFVSLGTGKVNLKDCYEAAKELEIPYIVYEQDCDWINDDPFLATEQSWEYMQRLLK